MSFGSILTADYSVQAKLHEFSVLEQQFTTIRQATGVNDLEEMVEKFIGQEGNRQTLLKEQREVEVTLAGARKKKDEAEAKFSELKASGIGSTEVVSSPSSPPIFVALSYFSFSPPPVQEVHAPPHFLLLLLLLCSFFFLTSCICCSHLLSAEP